LFAGYARYYVKAQLENLLHGRFKHFLDNAWNWTERNLGFSGFAREMVGVTGLRSLVRQIKSSVPALENQNIKGIAMPSKQYYAASLTGWLRQEITNTQIPYWLRSGEKNYMGMPFEARCPFLDYHVVEVAARMPITYLIRHGWHKWILRKAMEDNLPADVVWRRIKMGFPYPYEQFFSNYRRIIDLILIEARNPYIDFRRHEQLRTDWNAISFILWYELFINENKSLFRKIEERISEMEQPIATTYTPEFMKPCSRKANTEVKNAVV
jgi:asparagine synthase (glutamine-hydrolysing)